MESLEGVVERVTFVNGFFSTNKVRVTQASSPLATHEMVVIGHLGRLQEGRLYHFNGYLQRSPRHGLQFVAREYRSLE